MEKRTLIAIVLCVLFLIIWYSVLPPVPSEPGKPPEEKTPPAAETQPLEKKSEPRIEEKPVGAPAPKVLPAEAPLEENIEIETDLLKVVFTNRGAALVSVSLKDYKTTDKANALEVLRPFDRTEAPRYSLILLDNDKLIDLETVLYNVVEKTQNTLVFRVDFDNGLSITKAITVHPDRYIIGVEVTARNLNKKDVVAADLSLLGAAGISTEGKGKKASQDIEAAIGTRQGEGKIVLKRTRPSSLRKAKTFEVVSDAIAFAGVDNRYFLAVLMPKAPADFERARAHLIYDSDYIENVINKRPGAPPAQSAVLYEAARNIGVSLEMGKKVLAPGEEKSWEADFFVGPKDRRILAKYPGLDNLVNLGSLLRPLALLFLWFLNAFHKVIPNYGLAIICLTIIIRVLLHPLTKKSQASMYKMQRVQPKLKELQAKYKHDKQRMSQEQMKLWREHGVSPFGGCLTGMIVQIPVFFALFRMLRASIELRQAPFASWIDDLSQPDVLIELPFAIPLLGTNALSVLPILMIVSMVLSQHFTPKPVDPQAQQQQKFMKLMPVVFGFIFYTFPSGLVLYWLCSNVLQIAEQQIIRRELAAGEEAGETRARGEKIPEKKHKRKKTAPSKSAAKKKNDFFSRLFSR